MKHTRTLAITDETIRAYSRRGNYHSDPSTAAELGLPGLVAQGMQVAGAAYGALLDAWGDEFLERGEIDLRFVGTVLAGNIVDAEVDIDGDAATLGIVQRDDARTVVVGTARRSS